MGYAFLCDEEYYMSWDADTIPIKNAICLLMKGQYLIQKWNIIDRIFPP